MDLTLSRSEYRPDGVFGQLRDEANNPVAVTLEHAYTDGHGGFYPKVLPGEYFCERGVHRLLNSVVPFETFEVANVPGHTGILFHIGNYNSDSDGCVLLGESKGRGSTSQLMIVNSKATFIKFMALQTKVDRFILTVLG